MEFFDLRIPLKLSFNIAMRHPENVEKKHPKVLLERIIPAKMGILLRKTEEELQLEGEVIRQKYGQSGM